MSSPALPKLRSRSNSMDDVHETIGGGVRSQARLEVNGAAVHTDLFNTDALKGAKPRDQFGLNLKGWGWSHNDAEVSMLNQAAERFKAELTPLQDQPAQAHSVHIEYHGNHGPCDHCQVRFERANREFAKLIPRGTALNSSVHYAVPPEGGKRDGNTTYGYDGDEINESYGARTKQLHRHNLEPVPGEWQKPRKSVPRPQPQPKRAASSSSSQSRNLFDELIGVDENGNRGAAKQSGSRKEDKKALSPMAQRTDKQPKSSPNTSMDAMPVARKTKGTSSVSSSSGSTSSGSTSSGSTSSGSTSSGSTSSGSTSSGSTRGGSKNAASSSTAAASKRSWAAWGAGIGAVGGGAAGWAFGDQISRAFTAMSGGTGHQQTANNYSYMAMGAGVGAVAGAAVGKLADKVSSVVFGSSPGTRASSSGSSGSGNGSGSKSARKR